MEPVVLDGRSLDLSAFGHIAAGAPVALDPKALEAVAGGEAFVRRAVEEGRVAYGITTGFGHFASVTIPAPQVEALQRNLVRSHAVGVGDPLPAEAVRGMVALRINCLLRGRSGIRVSTLKALADLLNAGVLPKVPCQGSVGASGDLAPLAHIALVLMGEGEALYRGRWTPASEALAEAGLRPVTLVAKEGLALINGTQGLTALLALTALRARILVREADVVGALSLEALRGTRTAFDPRVHAERPYPGQVASARNLWALLEESPIRESHTDCKKVQDAYSLRCMPQVHGTVRDALDFVGRTLAIEMNAATDNPMIFSEDDEIISGGNFHGAPAALAADVLAVALTTLASMSERRCARMMDERLSGLPFFLVREGGLNSGFMMPQVTASALVSECKTLAHPGSADSIPTSANQEDHVSMGFWASRKAWMVAVNTTRVLGIEARAALQGLHLLRPLLPARPLQAVVQELEREFPPVDEDRFIGPELERMAEEIAAGKMSVFATLGGVDLA